MEIDKINRHLLLIAGIIVFLTHFLINLFLYYFDLEKNFLWHFVDYAFIFVFSLIIIIQFLNRNESRFVSISKFGEIFLASTKFLAVLILTFLGLDLLLKTINLFYTNKLVKFFEFEINFGFTILLSYFFLKDSFNWLNQLKTHNLKKYKKFLFITIIATGTLLLTIHPIRELGFDLYENDVKYLLTIIYAILFFLAFKVKIWLPYSSRNTQKSLLWYSLLMIGSSFVLVERSTENISTLHYSTFFFNETSKFFAFSVLITYIRVLYFSIISLPFSQVLAKKVYEVNSLSFLSRIVRNFNNLEKIFDVITEITSNTFNQSPTWIQLYENDKTTIKTYKHIEKHTIDNLIDLQSANNFFEKIKQPTLITQFSEFQSIEGNNFIKPQLESFCIVPITVRNKIIGHLVTANQSSYYFDEDDLQLISSYVETLCISIEGNNLLQETIEKEKYKQELLLGKKIQSDLLPKNIPNLPKLEIDVYFKPSEEVGGDFYEFSEVDKNKFFVLIGDVSGKGISAAFYMALLKGVFLSYKDKFQNPREFLKFANQSLYKQIDRQIHFTMAGILFDFESNHFEYIRGGHIPALIKYSNCVKVCNPPGIGISLVSNSIFEKSTNSLIENLVNVKYILLFTDGLVECLGNKDINLGLNVLKQILEKEVYNNATELKEKILENVNKSGTIFDDDITLIVLKYKG